MNRSDIKYQIVSKKFENRLDTPAPELWDWYNLSKNPNITWNIIKNNFDKPWNWHHLSSNPIITWDIVRQNPDKPWDWDML